MKKQILTILMVFVLVLALIAGIAFFYFKNVSILLVAALTHTNPPFSYLTDVRKTLLDQRDFQRMLKQHEAIALARKAGLRCLCPA